MTTTVVNLHREGCDVYIGRPGPWGNPFRIGPDGTREEVVQKYRDWIGDPKESPQFVALVRKELKGKRLGCWCKPLACHGDVLAEIADGADSEPQYPDPRDVPACVDCGCYGPHEVNPDMSMTCSECGRVCNKYDGRA